MGFIEVAEKMNVLVVDDDEGVRSSLSGFIESERHTYRTAKNGIEALKMLENELADLIITDISMPKMTGIELAKDIRAAYSQEDIKIVLSSGHQPTDSELRVIADIDIDDVIQKPFDISRLRQHLNPSQVEIS